MALFGFFNPPPPNEDENTNKTLCVDGHCKTEAIRLRRSLDITFDPCVDFYQFTCGNYNKAAKLPKHTSVIGSIEQRNYQIDQMYHEALMYQNESSPTPIKFVRKVYKMCIDGKLNLFL